MVENHPIENFPLWAMPLKDLFWRIRWFLHTLNGVLSMKLMPMHLPIGLDKYGQLDDCAFLKFNETAVRHNFRKKMPHVLAHMIEMLQTSIV